MVGTAAYMAPEQIVAGEATIQSDLYALGLVMYELFTGHRVWPGSSAQHLALRRAEASIPPPSILVSHIHHDIEAAIMRCLERDPAKRPSSAAAVAAMLPGGNALAAARSSGETPLPELVAVAGDTGALKPIVAVILLVVTLLSLVGGVLLSRNLRIVERLELGTPPGVLVHQARDLIQRLGYGNSAEFNYSDSGFYWQSRNVRLANYSDESELPDAVVFWYRQSPEPLVPMRRESHRENSVARVTLDDPPMTWPGMASVRMSPRGRLLELRVLPEKSAGAKSAPDWNPLFEVARLDRQAFRTAAPKEIPPVAVDHTEAWELSSAASDPSRIVRVEAGSFRGQPVWWCTYRAAERSPETGSKSNRLWLVKHMFTMLHEILDRVFYVLLMITAAFLAERNRRLRRIDAKGALRIAVFFFAIHLTNTALTATHVVAHTNYEIDLFRVAIGNALFWSGSLWILYLALEPYLRRWRPGFMISWSRLLEGRWRDPLVGRDILIGCTVMCASVVLVGVVHWLARSALGLHWMPSIPPPSRLEILLSPRHLASAFCDAIFNGIYSALAVLAALLVLFVILRKAWLAVGVMWLCATTFSWLYFGDRSVATFVFFAVWMSIFILVALRFGFLAYAACVFTFHAMVYIPVTIQDTWYAYLGWGGQLLIALLAAYGFYTSLAGQPIIADPFGYRRMHSSNATGSFGAGTSS